LPCVGNDVVDLKEPANSGKSRDSRFLKKILTDAEIEDVKNADNPDLALWSLWACKETAYKVIKKISSDIAFIPRRWQTVFDNAPLDDVEGNVIIPGQSTVYIRFFTNAGYVHCTGSDERSALDKLTWDVEKLPNAKTDPSIFARQRLTDRLTKLLSLKSHQIEIQRTRKNGELSPPQVYCSGDKTDVDISLSHDGRFVAYVVSQAEKNKMTFEA